MYFLLLNNHCIQYIQIYKKHSLKQHRKDFFFQTISRTFSNLTGRQAQMLVVTNKETF